MFDDTRMVWDDFSYHLLEYITTMCSDVEKAMLNISQMKDMIPSRVMQVLMMGSGNRARFQVFAKPYGDAAAFNQDQGKDWMKVSTQCSPYAIKAIVGHTQGTDAFFAKSPGEQGLDKVHESVDYVYHGSMLSIRDVLSDGLDPKVFYGNSDPTVSYTHLTLPTILRV